MASPLDSFNRVPIWQRVVIFFVVAGLIGAGWYFMFYAEAVENLQSAKNALAKADAELELMVKKKENFLERQRLQAKLEEDLEKKMEVLPMTTASVDNLMQTFQQQARLVGLTVESWTPSAEQKQDFYARLPVKVSASGTWSQAGEFFRRVSELDRIVSVENVTLTKRGGQSDKDDGTAPNLDLTFEAATYRFLSDAERQADDGSRRRQTARKNKK